MGSGKQSFSALVRASGRPPAKLSRWAAIAKLRALSLVVTIALAACASPPHAPERPPPVEISENTWRQVDSDIGAASLAAEETARNYASGYLKNWLDRIRQRTEADFIPWYASYWTQQWLSVKVAWYKLGESDGNDPAAKRLAAYLQEEYRERVLEPVAKEIDPDAAQRLATTYYVERLATALRQIPARHCVPQPQFDQRLRAIQAIALPSPPARHATLYQLVHAEPLARQPAFAALMNKEAVTPPEATISPVIEQAAEKLVTKFAVSGGTGAAARVLGGVAGMVVTLGAAGYSAIAHENERHGLEAQLRDDLNATLDDRWRRLNDPETGVMAAVDHIAGQLDRNLAKAAMQRVEFEATAPDAPCQASTLSR